MKVMGRYKVVGKRSFNEHPPGEVFEASINADWEARAIERGSIQLLERIAADLPDKYRLPRGWPGTATRKEG